MQQKDLMGAKKISDIKGFPFESFEDILSKEEHDEISLGAAVDAARQWLARSENAPRHNQGVLSVMQGLHLFLPISVMVWAIISGMFLHILYGPLVLMSFMFLRPLYRGKPMPPLNIVVASGYALLIVWFVWQNNWQIMLGLTILVPWWINKAMYKYALRTATIFGRSSEENFVFLFTRDVLRIKMPDGSLLSSFDFIDQEHITQ